MRVSDVIGWYVRLSAVHRPLSQKALSLMAPHLIHLQGFPLCIGPELRGPVPRSYSLVTAPEEVRLSPEDWRISAHIAHPWL